MSTTPGVVASSPADGQAVEAVKRHHVELSAGMAGRVEALLAAVESSAGARAMPPDVDGARADLVRFCETELLPHALAEESTFYAAGGDVAVLRLLVDGMTAEHRTIAALVEEVSAAASGVRAAAAARALLVLFEVHLAKENDLLLPALAADPAVSVAGLLEGMHEHLTG